MSMLVVHAKLHMSMEACQWKSIPEAGCLYIALVANMSLLYDKLEKIQYESNNIREP
jgi:hypothetical protein